MAIKKLNIFNENFLVDFLYSVFQKTAPAFDQKWFVNNEKYKKKAAQFFYYTSFFTKFFCFSTFGQKIVFIFFSFAFFQSITYFRWVVSTFAYEKWEIAISFMINEIPVGLLCLIFFVMFLMDISLINTFLVTCPSVELYIKNIYGDDFIKQQFYNSATLTAKASAQMAKTVAVGVAGGLVAGTVLNFYGEHAYRGSYESYLKMQTEHPNIQLKPPERPGPVVGVKFWGR